MRPSQTSPLAAAALLMLGFPGSPGFGARAVEASQPALQPPQEQGVPAPGRRASTAEAQIGEADRFVSQQKVEEARRLYESAAEHARAEGDAALEARALAAIGRMLSRTAKYSEARSYLERALAIAEAGAVKSTVAGIARSLGAVAESAGLLPDARRWYERARDAARAAGDEDQRITALFDIASLGTTLPSESVDLMREAAESAARRQDRSLEAKALHNWGDYLFTAGDFASAMEKLEAASAIYEGLADGESLARIYTSMGRLNRVHGRPEAAIPYYEKALAIQQKIGDRIGVVQSINATAVAYGALDQAQRANQYYERAYNLALETGDARAISFMRANLAGGLLEAGAYGRAAALLEEVLKGDVGPYASTRNSQLARAYLGLGRLADARARADLSVEHAAGRPTESPSAFLWRARVRERQGDVPGAIADARDAMLVIESVRARLVPLDFMKQGYSAQYQAVYSFLIGLYQRTGQPELALETAELARARAFLDLLATRDVRLEAAAQQAVSDLRGVRDALEARGVDTDVTIPGADGIGRSAALRGGDVDALIERWRKASPEMLSLVSARPLPVADLVAAARRYGSTILSYWVADEAVFIWAVPPSGRVEMRRAEVSRRRLGALVADAGRAGASLGQAGLVASGRKDGARGTGSRAAWRELSALLVDPVRGALPPPGGRLTVIPHDTLQRLSFAALQDTNGRYLIEDYALHYSPAGALLAFTAGRPETDASGRRYLLVADPALPAPQKGQPALGPLPGARAEVRAIARLVPPGSATVLLGPKADREAVTRAMADAPVLHFATHGVTRDDEPLDSYLALGQGPAQAGNGRITARDLYGFRLRADLVVLGACRSGGGRVTGEGLSALVRALFYAGARSIVASVWDVPDDAASRFLPEFYASWLGGRPRAEALRAAQLKLLGDLRAGRVKVKTPAGEFSLPEHPALWAGFILLGES